MTLPSSGTISGSQIAAAVGSDPTNISVGEMANDVGFSSPDAYSDFYNYNVEWVGFNTSQSPVVSSGESCTIASNSFLRYTDSNATFIGVNNRVRNFSTGQGIPDDGWYFEGNISLGQAYRLVDGKVVQNTGC